jgi:hypothetical protein
MRDPYTVDPAGELTFEWVERQLKKIRDAMPVQGWEDMQFPATHLKPGVSQPTQDATNGTILFRVGDDVFAQAQLPHAWEEGTVLKPHVHWYKTTSATGNVRWQLEYKWSKIGETMDAGFTTLAAEVPAVGDDDTAEQHSLTPLGDIVCTDGQQISDMLIMKLSRVAAVGTDYGAVDAALMEFDIHYHSNSHGSELEYTK